RAPRLRARRLFRQHENGSARRPGAADRRRSADGRALGRCQMNLQSLSRRLSRAAFMVTPERGRARLWIGDGYGRFLAHAWYSKPSDTYVVAFRESTDHAIDGATVERWLRLEANRLAAQL